MLENAKRALQSHFFSVVILLASATACSSNPLQTAPPTVEPARPAVSPRASQTPAGVVRPLAGKAQAAIYDGGSHRLVTLSAGSDPSAPASISIFGNEQTAPRTIALPGPATALACDGNGTAYAAGRGAYSAINLASGQIAQIGVADAAGTDFTAIARRADGKLVLGSADGALYTLAPSGTPTNAGTASVVNRSKIFARVDAVVTQGNTTVVLDRGQTSVTAIGAGGSVEQALRAGEGATTLAADPLGRVLVADTRGGQLLVYGVNPLILRQAYPVRRSPYGLAGSHDLAWVSQTASNLVIGYDLSTGIPVEKVRYPTVQQPNSLAFDETSGTLYVVSGSGAGVQVIEHAAGIP
ncbi:hypothetical protein [Mycobacterium basiliense]|uniref:YncE family protein n=1 Tax=Mycobacterium basiliense TaxID=2094119 RepID=UPI0013016EB0